MHLIDGKKIASELVQQVAQDTSEFINEFDVIPTLAVVLVGQDAASQVYVRNKVKRAKEAGFHSVECLLTAETTQAELNAVIERLNMDSSVHGILVQLPLPEGLNESEIINLIAVEKDVDGFHRLNVGALVTGDAELVPCTPLGCMIMLSQIHATLSGLNAVVIGRSNIVGKPIANLLLQANCTVTTVHSRTKNIKEICRTADILVVAIGKPEMVKDDWVKPGATIIDVGINAIEVDGQRRLVGDVDFASVEPIAGAITPVPGGVGPMTIACLMKNTLRAARIQMIRTSPRN